MFGEESSLDFMSFRGKICMNVAFTRRVLVQRMFSRLALAASNKSFETVSEISHRTGMDSYVLKSHLDMMVAEGEISIIKEDGMDKYKIAEGREGDI